jgi:hypothetical protein
MHFGPTEQTQERIERVGHRRRVRRTTIGVGVYVLALTAANMLALRPAESSTKTVPSTDQVSIGRDLSTSTRTTEVLDTSLVTDGEAKAPNGSSRTDPSDPGSATPVVVDPASVSDPSYSEAEKPLEDSAADTRGTSLLEPPSPEKVDQVPSVSNEAVSADVSGLPAEVVNRIPGPLRVILGQVRVTFGCHPVAGCHYGVWDEAQNTMWLADWLLAEPSLLYDVVVHELAHAADSHRLDSVRRKEVYAQFAGPARQDELLADCVARAVGASWTHYWPCAGQELQMLALEVLGLQ